MSRNVCVEEAKPASRKGLFLWALAALVAALTASPASASEADLKLPDLSSVSFFGIDGHNLLLLSLIHI